MSTTKDAPKGLVLVGRILSALKNPDELLPVSCTVDVIENTLEGPHSIPDSWVFCSKALRYGAGVAVHLSNFRPQTLRPNFRWRPYINPDHPDAKHFPEEYQVPASRTRNEIGFAVADSMEESIGTHKSIEESWSYFLKIGRDPELLHEDETLVVDVSDLRPQGDSNGRGLVASGPHSFCTIYGAIARFLQTGDLIALTHVYSSINEVLRRGGLFKNGAVTLHFDYDQPGAEVFATLERSIVPWARLALNIDDKFLDLPADQIDGFLSRVSTGDLFLVKKQYRVSSPGFVKRLYHNVCVAGDTEISVQNPDGTYEVKKVKDLVGKAFKTPLKGKVYKAPKGFWSTGENPTQRIETEEGLHCTATPDHRFLKFKGDWVELKDLKPGDKLARCIQDPDAFATVKEIVDAGVQETFDCTVTTAQSFAANGLIAHNCLEVLLDPRGTCLLVHENLGALKIHEIPDAFESGMDWVTDFHGKTGIERNPMYLSPTQDRQVGLGVLGLANLLAIEEITYLDHVRALEGLLRNKGIKADWTQDTTEGSPKAKELAEALYEGYQRAAKVAKDRNFERAFVIAPTASCSFNARDRHGYTTAPEIAPPIDTLVDRDSGTLGVLSVDYHPDCETAAAVGYETFFRLNCCWQSLMDLTGLAHAMSTNWWSDQIQMDRDWVKRFLASPLLSCYYALPVVPAAQDKSTTVSEPTGVCRIDNPKDCVACAE